MWEMSFCIKNNIKLGILENVFFIKKMLNLGKGVFVKNQIWNI